VCPVHNEVGGRSVRNAGTFTQDYTPEDSELPKYNHAVRYQVLIMEDQVQSLCKPFQLSVTKRKCDGFLSEHIGFSLVSDTSASAPYPYSSTYYSAFCVVYEQYTS
jgi:hypothetical protein